MSTPPNYNQGVLNILHALPAEMRDDINKDRIEKILLSLTPREKYLLRCSYGIDNVEQMSTYQLAEQLGIPQTTGAFFNKKSKRKMPH